MDLSCPILNFRRVCIDHGIHTLSFLAVLARVESGHTHREVARELGLPYSTVWQAGRALISLGLVDIEVLPRNKGMGPRGLLTLSESGREFLGKITKLLSPTTNQPTP